ncbi:MAG: hypothetical protein ACO4CS_17165 [bacterium]
MIKQKKKSFNVILDNPQGRIALMTVAGCIDMDECIEHVLKTKDKDFEILEIKEIKK